MKSHRFARMSHVVQINSNVAIRHAFTVVSIARERRNVRMEVTRSIAVRHKSTVVLFFFLIFISFPADITATPNRTCDHKTEFDCGDGMCIPLAKVCDKVQDCPNMEDEPIDKCGRDECKTNNGGCSHTCVETPAGYYCECRKGYKLLSDNRTCEDIDECELPGSCSQLCTNERGGYKVSVQEVNILE